ncbi:MAG TPA: NADP-dependent phosphogluconate dehydrogenase [Patescibacteria group bacterium]|nr:NADP-dependent phosphogluconate dehydrogenase [Patescibacteria group bacterium]
MQIAFIGLGKMGGRMAKKLLKEGHDVVLWNRSPEPVKELQSQYPDAKSCETVEELIKTLEKPRVVWSMLPAGEATDQMMEEVAKHGEKNDIVIDGANAKFTDTERHAAMFASKGIQFLGIGVSGGVIAGEQGYPMMVGGDKSAYDHITPILDSLAHPHGGHEYFGTGGAGHFVKMVHNGIEYPFMQAIGEGFGVLENSSYHFDLVKVAKLYQKNTLISGFMMDRTAEALEQDPHLDSIQGTIGSASGETIWTIEEAKKHNLPIESIEQARDFRVRSETEKEVQDSFAAKIVGALRIAFGGHPVKRK